MSEKYNSLTKVAKSLSHMSSEKEKHAALSRYEGYSYDDQVKIARCYLYLQQEEEATKEAAESGEEVDILTFKSAAQRLNTAIELAHYQALMEDETIQKKAEEAAAAGALMSSLLVDYVEKTAKGLPPEMKAMKQKMQKAKDKDDDGKKLEDTAGEHENLPDTKSEYKDWKEEKGKKKDKDKDKDED